MTGCISSRAQARPLTTHVRVLALTAVMLLTLLTPSLALALAAPSGLTVTSGAMADTLRWNRVRSSQTSAYRVERASVPSGPWKIVSRRTRATSLLIRVPSARTWYYRLRTIDRRGRVGAASAPVANSTVSISSVVGAGGATLRASNGQMSLALPAGAFASATRVTVREAGGLDTASYVKVTRAYDFRATAPLLAPASLTMRYKVPVTHFQVAAGLARSIDWMCLDAATGKWVAVPTTVDTAAGTFTAAMPHFSYWTAAVVDPHGMSKTQFCGDGNVCHALSPAPGSPCSRARTHRSATTATATHRRCLPRQAPTATTSKPSSTRARGRPLFPPADRHTPCAHLAPHRASSARAAMIRTPTGWPRPSCCAHTMRRVARSPEARVRLRRPRRTAARAMGQAATARSTRSSPATGHVPAEAGSTSRASRGRFTRPR
jgi:hypothetical protein